MVADDRVVPSAAALPILCALLADLGVDPATAKTVNLAVQDAEGVTRAFTLRGPVEGWEPEPLRIVSLPYGERCDCCFGTGKKSSAQWKNKTPAAGEQG